MVVNYKKKIRLWFTRDPFVFVVVVVAVVALCVMLSSCIERVSVLKAPPPCAMFGWGRRCLPEDYGAV